ncbi:hypothetical protein [Aquimarina spinulae]|uniref:hypothetical protein n=1 Tax=Aquimarina spinulae TaxID=1192023 RepID=UPI000D55B64B|nr:hypothetical protein [Aquimarina spinulae]
MKKNTLVIISFIFSLILASCGGKNNTTSNDSEETIAETSAVASYDLSEKGIPAIIEGPIEATIGEGMGAGEIDGIKTISLGITKDKFKLEINMDSAPSERTLDELVAFHKELSQEEEGFELIKEDSNGFIYKTTEDGETNHNFNYVKMNEKGDALEMTTGFSLVNYTLEEVEKMYEAAKKATWK